MKITSGLSAHSA